MKQIERVEYKWLEEMYKTIKELRVTAPVGVSIHPGHGRAGIERIEPISDILLIHPYCTDDQDNEKAKEKHYKHMDDYVDVREKTNKPMLITETCWGSLDDEWRADNIRFTLGELKKRNLGWFVHALYHSLVADLHRPEHGVVGGPGFMSFIEKDGSLREGHEAFNEF